MLGVRGFAARQGVLFDDMCSLMVYFFANFSCLCSLRYAFQPHSKVCVPSGYTISRFLIVFYVLSESGSGSQGSTTPSILLPIPPPPGKFPSLLLLTFLIKNFRFKLQIAKMLLISSGSVETNPGPKQPAQSSLSFALWNLDSLPARQPVIESLQSVYNIYTWLLP